MIDKHQYVLWADQGVHPGRFAHRLWWDVAPRLSELGPFSLKVTVTDAAPPGVSLFPFRREPAALVTLAGESLPDPARCAEVLRPHGRALSGYAVDESTPVSYEEDQDWAEGERTPGVCLVTLFQRKKGLDDTTFMDRWHGGHTALTLRTHPVWCYVRNVVRRPLLAGSAPFDGIVEEHFRGGADLLDPARFYGHGSSLRALLNMGKVGVDILQFMDLPSMEVYLAAERWVRQC